MQVNKLREIIGNWGPEIEEEANKLVNAGYLPWTALATSIVRIKKQKMPPISKDTYKVTKRKVF